MTNKCGSDALGVAILLVANFLFPSATALAQPPITLDAAWVRAAPPSVQMLAGYLTVHNATRDDIALTAVESAQFERVDLHRSTVVDGVARMEAVDAAVVPARGTLALAPGGLHLMLVGPRGPLPAGSEVVLLLTFDNGWTVEIDAPVQAAPR